MRVTLLAGGSGGHISPAFAVASELQKQAPAIELVFFCSRNAVDRSIYEKSNHKYYRIFSGKIRRYFDWRNFTDPFLLVLGIFQSLILLIGNRPDVIFSKGGFVSVAPAIAAFLLKIPIVVHESDAVEGIANRVVSKIAKKKLTAFPGKAGTFTGTPIRPEILTGSNQAGKEFLGFLDHDKPILFFYGGSQGSSLLNQMVERNLPELKQMANIVLVHGSNKPNLKADESLRLFPYLRQEFANTLAAASIIISRAGSSSLFEAAAAEKAMLLIPLKSAAGNHQVKNADIFRQKNAAIVLPEDELSDQTLVDQIKKLIEQPELRSRLGKNAAALVKLDAAAKIAATVLQVGSKAN